MWTINLEDFIASYIEEPETHYVNVDTFKSYKRQLDKVPLGINLTYDSNGILKYNVNEYSFRNEPIQQIHRSIIKSFFNEPNKFKNLLEVE